MPRFLRFESSDDDDSDAKCEHGEIQDEKLKRTEVFVSNESKVIPQNSKTNMENVTTDSEDGMEMAEVVVRKRPCPKSKKIILKNLIILGGKRKDMTKNDSSEGSNSIKEHNCKDEELWLNTIADNEYSDSEHTAEKSKHTESQFKDSLGNSSKFGVDSKSGMNSVISVVKDQIENNTIHNKFITIDIISDVDDETCSSHSMNGKEKKNTQSSYQNTNTNENKKFDIFEKCVSLVKESPNYDSNIKDNFETTEEVKDNPLNGSNETVVSSATMDYDLLNKDSLDTSKETIHALDNSELAVPLVVISDEFMLSEGFLDTEYLDISKEYEESRNVLPESFPMSEDLCPNTDAFDHVNAIQESCQGKFKIKTENTDSISRLLFSTGVIQGTDDKEKVKTKIIPTSQSLYPIDIKTEKIINSPCNTTEDDNNVFSENTPETITKKLYEISKPDFFESYENNIFSENDVDDLIIDTDRDSSLDEDKGKKSCSAEIHSTVLQKECTGINNLDNAVMPTFLQKISVKPLQSLQKQTCSKTVNSQVTSSTENIMTEENLNLNIVNETITNVDGVKMILTYEKQKSVSHDKAVTIIQSTVPKVPEFMSKLAEYIIAYMKECENTSKTFLEANIFKSKDITQEEANIFKSKDITQEELLLAKKRFDFKQFTDRGVAIMKNVVRLLQFKSAEIVNEPDFLNNLRMVTEKIIYATNIIESFNEKAYSRIISIITKEILQSFYPNTQVNITNPVNPSQNHQTNQNSNPNFPTHASLPCQLPVEPVNIAMPFTSAPNSGQQERDTTTDPDYNVSKEAMSPYGLHPQYYHSHAEVNAPKQQLHSNISRQRVSLQEGLPLSLHIASNDLVYNENPQKEKSKVESSGIFIPQTVEQYENRIDQNNLSSRRFREQYTDSINNFNVPASIQPNHQTNINCQTQPQEYTSRVPVILSSIQNNIPVTEKNLLQPSQPQTFKQNFVTNNGITEKNTSSPNIYVPPNAYIHNETYNIQNYHSQNIVQPHIRDHMNGVRPEMPQREQLKRKRPMEQDQVFTKHKNPYSVSNMSNQRLLPPYQPLHQSFHQTDPNMQNQYMQDMHFLKGGHLSHQQAAYIQNKTNIESINRENINAINQRVLLHQSFHQTDPNMQNQYMQDMHFLKAKRNIQSIHRENINAKNQRVQVPLVNQSAYSQSQMHAPRRYSNEMNAKSSFIQVPSSHPRTATYAKVTSNNVHQLPTYEAIQRSTNIIDVFNSSGPMNGNINYGSAAGNYEYQAANHQNATSHQYVPNSLNSRNEMYQPQPQLSQSTYVPAPRNSLDVVSEVLASSMQPEYIRSSSTDSGFLSPTTSTKDSAATFDPVITSVQSLNPNTEKFEEFGNCQVCKTVTNLACTGCYKVYYCSHKCSTVDWNIQHRDKCR